MLLTIVDTGIEGLKQCSAILRCFSHIFFRAKQENIIFDVVVITHTLFTTVCHVVIRGYPNNSSQER